MIFLDLSQKRWKKIRLIFIAVAFLVIIIFVVGINNIITNPSLPLIAKNNSNRRMALDISQEILKKELNNLDNKKDKIPSIKNNSKKKLSINEAVTNIKQLSKNGTLSTAFLVQSDKDSFNSFEEHAKDLDIVFPDWYLVKSASCQVEDMENKEITVGLNNNHVSIFPRVSNGDNDIWYSKEVGAILKDSKTRLCLAENLARLTKNAKVGGINIDFEDLNIDDREVFLEFLVELTNLFHQQNQLVTIDVSADDPALDLEQIAQVVDAVVLMLYDENYSTGKAGPIASQDWAKKSLEETLTVVPKDKLIVSLGSYGYDWIIDSKLPAQSLRFNETMHLAQDLEIQPELEPLSKNMFFAYLDKNKNEHRVWFLNGVTAYNQWLMSSQYQVLGFSLWRLGIEDPTFWNLWNKKDSIGQSFSEVPNLTNVSFESQGEFFHLRHPSLPGSLELTFASDKSIEFAKYLTLPSGYVIERAGEAIPAKNLILTFDDGPDPKWTPAILKVLKRFQVPAVFFVTGEQAQKNPAILQAIAKEGHLIGNHTYLHSNILNVSDLRLKLELNETQRVIESNFGKQTILFRPPYDISYKPDSSEELKNIMKINELGYAIVSAGIDSNDWQEPGVEEIMESVISGADTTENHIILMHDSGGDRLQTVAALERFIPILQDRGFTFVSLDQGSGISSKILNPSLNAREATFARINKSIYGLRRWALIVIYWLFYFTTIVAVIRILFLGALVLRSASRKHHKINHDKIPKFVSVLISAYNEEQTIGKTLITLEKSDWKNFEVLVIDDGSTDRTAEVVKKLQKKDHRIRLISKPNGGKSSALNLGFKEARADIVVTIDADTILLPQTLTELVKPFADHRISAVCGNVEVGNVKNVLTGFQSLEYITSQNFDRRAFDEINGIGVVPGATGAWRKDKILSIGGYLEDTLTEDADLTLRLLAHGEKIVYAPKAISRTEAPETISGLIKQRFRWSFGTFQCLYKNRRLFFKGVLGWVSLPNILFFQIIFPVLAPIGDLMLVVSILAGNWHAILLGYLFFTFVEASSSLLAFVLEKRNKKLMWLILIQRFFYRQFMYVIAYRSLLAVLKGRRHGWNKLERTGNVSHD